VGKLVLFLADGTTLDIPLERDRVSIGRRKSNDVCLPYPAVSGEHAVVVPVTAGAVIEDLGSTNGTFINGKRVPRQFLHDGDRIDIGRQKLVYLADTNAVAPPLRERAGREPERTNQDEPTRMDPADAVPAAPGKSLPEQDPPAATVAAGTSGDPDPVVESGPMLRVTSGPSAGRRVMLAKDETLVGRVGAHVAMVRRMDDGFRLLPVEGPNPPTVNGKPVPAGGVMLRPGDLVEVASTGMEFVLPGVAQPG
jgi:predicted component of type VI protein secretion system